VTADLASAGVKAARGGDLFSIDTAFGSFFGTVGEILVAVAKAAKDAVGTTGSFFGSGIMGMFKGIIDVAVLCLVGYAAFLAVRWAASRNASKSSVAATQPAPKAEEQHQPIYALATEAAVTMCVCTVMDSVVFLTSHGQVLVHDGNATWTGGPPQGTRTSREPSALEVTLASALVSVELSVRAVMNGDLAEVTTASGISVDVALVNLDKLAHPHRAPKGYRSIRLAI